MIIRDKYQDVSYLLNSELTFPLLIILFCLFLKGRAYDVIGLEQCKSKHELYFDIPE